MLLSVIHGFSAVNRVFAASEDFSFSMPAANYGLFSYKALKILNLLKIQLSLNFIRNLKKFFKENPNCILKTKQKHINKISSSFEISYFQGHNIVILPFLGTIKIHVKKNNKILLWYILSDSYDILKWNYDSNQSGIQAPLEELPLSERK